MEHSLDFVSRLSSLPAPPPVLQRISAVLANRESSAADAVQAIKLDPSTAGRILKLANSAYIGIPRTVSSLQNAVVLLGTKRISSLVIASELLTPFHLSDRLPFGIRDFWRHSTTVAIIAESIAKHLRRYDMIETEEVFSAALLHDIGKIVLGCLQPSVLIDAYGKSQKARKPLFQMEDADCSHTRAGGMLAENWNFPEDLRNAISGHHVLASSGEQYRLNCLVHISDAMAHVLGYGTLSTEVPPECDTGAFAFLQLPPERLRVIAESAINDEKRIEAVVDTLHT